MKITIKAPPKEIATLVLALQEQREQNDMTFDAQRPADQISQSIRQAGLWNERM